MKRTSGKLDSRALAVLGHANEDYLRRAGLHKPDLDGTKAEAMRLLATGLSVRSVARALKLADDVVRNWAAEPRT